MEARARELAALDRTQVVDPTAQKDSDAALGEAVMLRCDDPLVRYWALSREHRHGLPTDWRRSDDRAVYQALWDSGYPDVRKLHAVHNLLAEVAVAGAKHPCYPERAEWEGRFWEAFGRVAADHNPFAEGNVIEVSERRSGLTGEGRTRERNHAEVDRALVRAGARKHVRMVVRGRVLIAHAWAARGSGFAGTVSPEGWRLLRERLTDALEAAPEAEPVDWRGPTAMLQVCLGLPLDRDEVEEWFARAMKANPDNGQACYAKLTYLSPKWHGDVAAYSRFGWQCVRTGNHDALIPYVPAQTFFQDATTWLHAPPGQLAAARRFYADRRVWAVVREGLEGHLARRPGDVKTRSELARAACLGGHYDVARREFDTLGNQFDWGVFPGKPEWYEFRDEAGRGAPADGARDNEV